MEEQMKLLTAAKEQALADVSKLKEEITHLSGKCQSLHEGLDKVTHEKVELDKKVRLMIVVVVVMVVVVVVVVVVVRAIVKRVCDE